eukprot:13509484-Alexandrium_andersonii.AAC.1
MAMAGWPTHPLAAYISYQESMCVHASFSGALGAPRRRPRSIPQGCPWSMAILALVTTPWIRLTLAESCSVPRVLADDLLIFTADDEPDTSQEDHLDRHVMATQITVDFVNDMGSALSAKKCIAMSTSAHIRSRLKRWRFPGLKDAMTVAVDMRDLGAHLSMGARRIGTT